MWVLWITGCPADNGAAGSSSDQSELAAAAAGQRTEPA